MIGERQFRMMKRGACFINNSRGTVVDLNALANALRDKHVSGAAVDVFPVEPSSNMEKFVSPLQGLGNVILTPHVGGSTEEAQERIGAEVARKFVDFTDNGSTSGAVNFPQVLLPARSSGIRFLHVHGNMPGGLGRLNETFAQRKVNIAAQYCQTEGEIGYVVLDVEGTLQDAPDLLAEIQSIPGTICARLCLSRSSHRNFLISTRASKIWLRPQPKIPQGASLHGTTPAKSKSARALEVALECSVARRSKTQPSAASASNRKPA
jgi:D-3-phosphoglycerate dehydrogenase